MKTYADDFGDELEVDTEAEQDKVFFTVNSSNNVMLSVSQVKQIRRQLKDWLIKNGYKEKRK